MYSSKTMLWKEERSRVRVIQMDNLRGLLGIRRMDRVPNAWIKELCRVKKGVNERIDKGVLRWFGHEKRMERVRNATRVYVGVCAGSRSVDWQWKRWIDTVKVFKEKVWISGKQGEWSRIRVNGECLRGNTWGVARGMNP